MAAGLGVNLFESSSLRSLPTISTRCNVSQRLPVFKARAKYKDLKQGNSKNALRARDSAVAKARTSSYPGDIDAEAEFLRKFAELKPRIGEFGMLNRSMNSYDVYNYNTDGISAKLKLALELDICDTIGIDLVAMTVNDILGLGAVPVIFIPVFSLSCHNPDLAEQVIKGVINGCRQSNSLLQGGPGEGPKVYNLKIPKTPESCEEFCGLVLGYVKTSALIDGKTIEAGDHIIGLASSGVHSSDFTVVRKVLSKDGASLHDPLPGDEAVSIGKALLAPSVIYVKEVLELIAKGGIKGVVHITNRGGGLAGNIPRVFTKESGLGALVKIGTWNVLPIFDWIQQAGGIEKEEL